MAGKLVLVVDDEFHIVQVVSIKLRNNGFEVITADNGLDAWKMVQEHRPDVVITDYQMPGLTGIELIEKIRSDEKTAQTPVILLTARGFAIDDEKQQALAVTACLSKPFSPREVLQTVENAIVQKAAV